MILGRKSIFGRKWPKMWPTCIFRPGEGLEGLKNGFEEPLRRGAEPAYRGAFIFEGLVPLSLNFTKMSL